MRRTLTIMLVLVSTTLLADYPLEIIELKSRPMEEVLPVIRPFVSSDGSVSGMNNQLILRTSPESLQDIQEILRRIDTPPRSLLISVRQGERNDGRAGGISADVNTMIGDRTKVIVGRPGPDDTIRLQGLSADTRSNDNLISSVRTMEGRPAFIVTGQSLPVTTYRRYGGGYYPHVESNTVYRDATSGFYALPRVNGQQVTVEVSPQRSRPGTPPGALGIMQASTTISGQLGEWISLGGVVQTTNNRQRGIGFSASSEQTGKNDIWLKVEELR